jgi:type II secretory pathway pseudopilin PulG
LAGATLQEVLRSATPTTEDLAMINIDGGASYRKLVRRTLFMDEAFILNLFAGLDNSDLNQWLTALGIREQPEPFGQGMSLYRVFLLTDDLAGYRRAMRESEEAISLRSYVDSRGHLSAIVSEVANQRPGIVAGLVLPSVSGANETAFRTDARHAVAQTGLAMHRYRAMHGTFPDKLQQLSPEVISLLPRDPYDGIPLRLKKTATGWIVYSVGPDLKDESGRKFDDSKNTGDLTFEYVEPTPQGPPK